jgi:hypothetical protein
MKSGHKSFHHSRNPSFGWSDRDDIFRGIPGSVGYSFAFWDALLLSPVEFLLRLSFRTARRLAHEILRRQRVKECRPTPSLRGAPGPGEIDEVWNAAPRTLIERLRLGSRLLDLEPTVDNSFVYKENRTTGRREIVARHSGVKGWLRLHCPHVAYTTAMAYKKLAARLKTLCGAPGEVPLEWLLPGAPEISSLTQDKRLAATIGAGRKRLKGFLEEGNSFAGVCRVAEEGMKIVRLPTKKARISLISSKGKKETAAMAAALVAALRKGEGDGRNAAALRELARLLGNQAPPVGEEERRKRRRRVRP